MSFVVAKVRKNSLSRLQQNYFFSIGPLFTLKEPINLVGMLLHSGTSEPMPYRVFKHVNLAGT